jgi:hypothetical protein
MRIPPLVYYATIGMAIIFCSRLTVGSISCASRRWPRTYSRCVLVRYPSHARSAVDQTPEVWNVSPGGDWDGRGMGDDTGCCPSVRNSALCNRNGQLVADTRHHQLTQRQLRNSLTQHKHTTSPASGLATPQRSVAWFLLGWQFKDSVSRPTCWQRGVGLTPYETVQQLLGVTARSMFPKSSTRDRNPSHNWFGGRSGRKETSTFYRLEGTRWQASLSWSWAELTFGWQQEYEECVNCFEDLGSLMKLC